MNYLQWISIAVLLATLQGSTSQQAKPIPTGDELCKHPFHAHLCNSPKTSGRRRVYNGQPSGASQPPSQNQLTGANSFPQGTRLRPNVPEEPNLIPDTSNVFQAEAYLPPVGSKPPPPERKFVGGGSNLQSALLLPPTEKPKTRPTPPPKETTRPTTRAPPPPPPPTRPPPPPPKPTTRPPPPPTRPPPPPPKPTTRRPPPPPTRPPPPPPRATTRPPPPPSRPTTRPPPPPPRPTTRPSTTRPPPPETPLRFDANQNSGVKVLPDKKKHEGCAHSFHSFLCDTKKSTGRRRIYNGQRPSGVPEPSNIIGANSFVQPERILPPQKSVSQPNTIAQGSSLLGENIYLPPSKQKTPPPTRPPPPSTTSPYKPPPPPPPPNPAPYLPPPPPPTAAAYLPPPPPPTAAPYKPPPPPPRSRLDPEVQPAAAQNPSVRIAPNAADKSEGCKHSFHSFLCEPSKSKGQRRIYNGQRPGASPPNPNVIGQNSFLQPSKLLPPPQKARPPPSVNEGSLLLSSNLKPNTYLPPQTPKPTYLPPQTTKPTYTPPPRPTPTYLPPKPQNNNLFGDNSFLDPSRLPPPTEKTPVKRPPPKPTTPRSTTPRPTSPRQTTPRPTTPRTTARPTTTRPTTPRPTTPRPTTYKPRPQPDIRGDAAQNPSVQIRPDPPTQKKENCGHSFHSFLCEPSKSSGRRRIHNGRKPDVTPQGTNFIGENTFLRPETLNPPPPPPQPPKPSGGSLLLGENSFPQSTQVRPNANTYLPPPQPTTSYLPPKPKGPPTNINFFGDNTFLDPERLRPPTQKSPPPTTARTTTPPRTTPYRPVTRATTPYRPPVTQPPPPPRVTRPTPPPTTPRPRPDVAPAPAQNTNVLRRPDEPPRNVDTHSFHSFLYQKPKSGGRRIYNGQRQTRSKRHADVLGDITNLDSLRALRRSARQAPTPAAGGDHDHHHHDDHHGDHHHGDHHGDDHHHHHHHNITLEQLCRDPFHAFLCDPVDTSRRQVYDGERYTPDKRGRIKGKIFGASSVLHTQRVRPEPNSLIAGVSNNKDATVANTLPAKTQTPTLSAASFKTVQQNSVFQKTNNPSPSFPPVTTTANLPTNQPIQVRSGTLQPIVVPELPSSAPSLPIRQDFGSLENIRTALLKERVNKPSRDPVHQRVAEIIRDADPPGEGDVILQPIEIRQPNQFRLTPPAFAEQVVSQGQGRRRPKVIDASGENLPRQQQRRRRPKPRPFALPAADLEDERTTHTPIHRSQYFDSLHDWQGAPNRREFGQKTRQRRLPEGESLEEEVAITPVSPAVFARGPRGITATHLTSDDKCVFTFQGGYQCSSDKERGERAKREDRRVFTGQGRPHPAVDEDVEVKIKSAKTAKEEPQLDDKQTKREEQLNAREEALSRREEQLKKREQEFERRTASAGTTTTTTEDPLVAYQREVDEELKRREEEQKRRDDELARRKEEDKNREDELERRKAQDVEVKKESERRKVQDKQVKEELERRKEERVKVKLEEERRKKIKELDEDGD